MTKRELKDLIKECISEVQNEQSMDEGFLDTVKAAGNWVAGKIDAPSRRKTDRIMQIRKQSYADSEISKVIASLTGVSSAVAKELYDVIQNYKQMNKAVVLPSDRNEKVGPLEGTNFMKQPDSITKAVYVLHKWFGVDPSIVYAHADEEKNTESGIYIRTHEGVADEVGKIVSAGDANKFVSAVKKEYAKYEEKYRQWREKNQGR